MKIQINHFSQHDPQIHKAEQNKSCGICCVKMLLDFLHPDNQHEIADLIQEAKSIGAFNQNLNGGLWTHEGLVRILRNHGSLAYPQEFKAVYVDLKNKTFNENPEQVNFTTGGVQKIKLKLAKGKPVIVSVTAGFNKNQDDHLIIINGYEDNNSENSLNNNPIESFYITDPQDKSLEKVCLESFLKHWKKLAIFVD